MGDHSNVEVDAVVNSTVRSQERKTGPPIHALGEKRKKKYVCKGLIVELQLETFLTCAKLLLF